MTLEEFKEELEKLCPTASYGISPKTGEIFIYTGLKEEDSGELIEIDELDEDFDFSDTAEDQDLFEDD